ncbi:hypothetical protein AB0B63_07385 [Micromonospora sp. NPDC049081]|uniref:hypothetical protein n=1 Tax=Micromonospora sp. NPDC049081 TaxID=3155150 RepID=UPI0033DFC363
MTKRFTTKQTIGITLTSLFTLCCCGGGITAAFNSDTPKPVSAPTTSASVEVRKLGGALASLDPTAASPTPDRTAATTTAAPKATRTPTARKTTSLPRTTAPKPKPKPTPARTTASVQNGVHPGAYCSPRGALGRTVKGTLMRCGPSATDDRNRWRAA